MQKRLDDLYHIFCNRQDFTNRMLLVEENSKSLIDQLTESDAKVLLRIIDELEMICNHQSKASFIGGFKLGFELTTELQNYNSHSAEIDSQNCGNSFMPQEVQKNEEEN